MTTNASDEFTYSNVPVNIVSFLGAVLNVLLLVAFLKDPLKCFRNSGSYLVTNLSVTDCLSCVFGLFFYPVYSSFRNRILVLFVLSIGIASLASITSISIDRSLMIACPIKHRIYMRGKLMALWIASIWIVSFIIPASRIVLARKRDEKLAVYTFCALLIISSAAFYTYTYYNLKKQSSNAAFNIQNSDETRAQKARILKEKQFLKTIIIIACISFICVVPSMVVFQLYSSLSLSHNVIYVFAFNAFTCIFYANFAVNPIIYVIRLPNYRKTFYLLYWKRRRKRQNGEGIVSQ